jgi:hypothetical protein
VDAEQCIVVAHWPIDSEKVNEMEIEALTTLYSVPALTFTGSSRLERYVSSQWMPRKYGESCINGELTFVHLIRLQLTTGGVEWRSSCYSVIPQLLCFLRSWVSYCYLVDAAVWYRPAYEVKFGRQGDFFVAAVLSLFVV